MGGGLLFLFLFFFSSESAIGQEDKEKLIEEKGTPPQSFRIFPSYVASCKRPSRASRVQMARTWSSTVRANTRSMVVNPAEPVN